MADLTFSQSSDPVSIFNDSSGNQLIINSDGTLNSRLKDGSGNSITQGQTTMAQSLPVVVASNQTSLPISAGLPPFLAQTFGFAVSINQLTAATDNPLIYLRNPSGSGKTLYVSFIMYGISVQNVFGTVGLFRNPTVTSVGTTQTIVPFGGGTTAMLLTTIPTVTANGTWMINGFHGQNNNALLLPINYEIVINPNESLLLTGNPQSNNRQAEISLRWLEV